MELKTVAFIGAGSMGAPMARNARQAGFDVIVCDRSQSVLDAFLAEGACVTTSAADCASADAIVVLLASDAQIIEVMLGAGGVVDAIPAGRRPLVCMMSTTLPDTLHTLDAALKTRGARLVDAPVSGGIVGAEQATLSIMMGGEPEDVAAVMPLMRSMGSEIFHCGALGAGEVVKVVNNMLCIANMFLTAEAIELAERHGVSFERLAPILNVSTGRNFLTQDAALGRSHYGAWARSEAAFASLHQVVSKDLHLARKLAGLADVDLRLLDEVSGYLDAADDSVARRWMRHGRVIA